MAHSTYEKLVTAAAVMFHKQGYAVTSISEILELAGVPRGSLYHHFPGGKQALAIAAAWQSSDLVVTLIRTSFETAREEGKDFKEAIRLICNSFASKYESEDRWQYSPVSGMLLDPTGGEGFHDVTQAIYRVWRQVFIAQSKTFGVTDEQALLIAKKLSIILEGAWVMSRATEKSDPFFQAAAFMMPCTKAILAGDDPDCGQLVGR
ncbi:TetR/AcrR family transcriptional regulator [uncultured Cohaesibacter sp.]|uniref:TetR/AcrR family transcriptional regulator n=1 Tax=uncultured Cohaesibacter sp. TaxID=1002546 RepID=UPI0029C64D70|nr:TetR/AcrR family transcriptional regulator [uncultured Cohaesibacter sp.]